MFRYLVIYYSRQPDSICLSCGRYRSFGGQHPIGDIYPPAGGLETLQHVAGCSSMLKSPWFAEAWEKVPIRRWPFERLDLRAKGDYRCIRIFHYTSDSWLRLRLATINFWMHLAGILHKNTIVKMVYRYMPEAPSFYFGQKRTKVCNKYLCTYKG